MRNSAVVANRILALAQERGDALTPMQILKLVYISHGWMLGLYGRPLISDDVEAWQYGPVIRPLYGKLRAYQGRPVTNMIPLKTSDSALDAEEDNVVQQVYDLYGSKTGPALSRITHAPRTPWSLTYREGEFGKVIPMDLIEDHYRRLADRVVEPKAA
jgi:uncharacterized phage-associated protein